MQRDCIFVNDVIELYGLPRGANIKKRKIIETILSQITLTDVKSAISRAKQICDRKLPADAITVGTESDFENPDLSLHRFIDMVISDIPS